MENSRQVKNRESAERSRGASRQLLGDTEFKRRKAEAEKARRKKKKEELELAQFAAEGELEEDENQQTQVPQAYQPAHQQARQQEQLAASIAAERQRLQALQQEVVETQAKLDATKAAAAAAAAAASPPPPPQPAAAPPPAAPTAESPPAWKPLPDDLTPLSDALGVSSAPILGVWDVIKLAAVLEACGDIARVDGALRRLQGLTLTPQLSGRTRIDQIVAALQSHDNPGVCALSKSITSAWSTQLVAERQRLALGSKPGPNRRAVSAGCAACMGAHRAHTCVKA